MQHFSRCLCFDKNDNATTTTTKKIPHSGDSVIVCAQSSNKFDLVANISLSYLLNRHRNTCFVFFTRFSSETKTIVCTNGTTIIISQELYHNKCIVCKQSKNWISNCLLRALLLHRNSNWNLQSVWWIYVEFLDIPWNRSLFKAKFDRKKSIQFKIDSQFKWETSEEKKLSCSQFAWFYFYHSLHLKKLPLSLVSFFFLCSLNRIPIKWLSIIFEIYSNIYPHELH